MAGDAIAKRQEADWFAAIWRRWLTLVCVVTPTAFVTWELRSPHPIVNLRVLANRNLAVGAAMGTLRNEQMGSATGG